MSWVLKIALAEQTTNEELLCSSLWDTGSTGMATANNTLIAGFTTSEAAVLAADTLGVAKNIEQVDQSWQQPTLEPVEIQTPHGPVPLELETAQVFGHGHHPTTQLTLRLLEQCVASLDTESLANFHFLDVGTGSGILAIAAAKFGIGTVHAIDIDTNAIAAAQTNAEKNDVSLSVSNSSVKELGPSFDIIACNVLLPMQQELAQEILQKINPSGWLALSGFLEEQIDAVTQCYKGLSLLQTNTADGWASMLLENPYNSIC